MLGGPVMQGNGGATDSFSFGPWVIRCHTDESDLSAIVRLHEQVYGPEYGFDASFADYVREPLREFLGNNSKRGRLWLAERENRLAGCIALVELSSQEAQLRWFVVGKEHRGGGLGGRLVAECVGFAKQAGYRSVILWTVDLLQGAARAYARAGFTLVESRPGKLWSRDLVEQKMVLNLR